MSKKQQNASPETVLLRQPLPKYNFQARKLSKEAPATKTPTQTTQSANLSSAPTVQSSTPTTQNTYVSQPFPQTSLPDNSHHGSAAPKISSTMHRPTSESSSLHSGADRRSAAIRPFSLSARQTDNSGAVRPMAAVVAPNLRAGAASQEKGAVKFDLGASGNAGAQTAGAVLECKSGALPVTFLQSAPVVYSEANDIPVPDAALLAYAVEGPSTAEKLEKAEKEIEMLKAQLEVQLQVNAEIKRLLVASVGDDFERKVENLARDRAELAMNLGDFTKKMTEDYENLDQISIQADMWRSKYLASRVMVEELAAARAFYSSQFQDSQQCVQELLNERYELRANLVQSYKCLQQVKEAFDPFNSQKSHSLPSTNVLDLSKNIKQLSDAVRYRLLPAHAGAHVMMPLEESWESTMTRAELLAYEQLSKQTTPPSFKHSMPSPIMASSTSYQRFHPMARHDNITVNCCLKCNGEIIVA